MNANVLIIDDNADIRTIITTMLESLGAKVSSVGSGDEASSFLKSDSGTKTNLILLDIHMPNLDGYGTAKLLRGDGYKGAIVVFTANATVSGKKECGEFGINGYFSKTTLKKDLLQALLEQHCS